MADLDMYGKPVAAPGPTGIGGWMILPLIGLVGTLALTAFNLFMGLKDLSPDVLREIMRAETPQMETVRLAFAISMLAGFAIVGTASHALHLFARKRRALPNSMVAHYLTVMVALGGELYAAHLIDSLMPGQGGVDEALQWVIRGALWITYFKVSDRVKNTFVN